MDTTWIPLLEALLIIGLVFGFGFRELWLLKRDRERRAAEDGAKDAD